MKNNISVTESSGKRAIQRFMIITSVDFEEANKYIEDLGLRTDEEKIEFLKDLFNFGRSKLSQNDRMKDYKTLLLRIMRKNRSEKRPPV